MLIETDSNQKKLITANVIQNKLVTNNLTDNFEETNYINITKNNQLKNLSLNETNTNKMNSLSQYQIQNLNTNNNGNLPLLNQRNSHQSAANLNRITGNINQHGTLGRSQQNFNLTTLQNNLISNYATISRAAAQNQLNGQLGKNLLTQVPNSHSHINTHINHYQQLIPLNNHLNQLNQLQISNGNLITTSNGIYGSTHYLQQKFQPHYVGLEVGLELVDNGGCCFKKKCNISKVIAFICGIVVLFLMTLCTMSSNWLIADKYQQGLWEFCVDEGASLPLPFDLNVDAGCYPVKDKDYIRLAGILCCFGFILDLLATLMTGFGLCSCNSYKKYALYKFALYIMIGALIVILTALVIYPAWLASEIKTSNRQVWEFGWAYGIGWGSCIFLIGAILLLLCDKDREDIYYRERTIIQNPSGIREVKA